MTTGLITGCSSGLGRAVAEAVLARGDNAVVTARGAANVRDLAYGCPECHGPGPGRCRRRAGVYAAVTPAVPDSSGISAPCRRKVPLPAFLAR
jgi:NAD(P)-dependent dehydrogenase (short-subunit alcohol dehydrogenase family)